MNKYLEDLIKLSKFDTAISMFEPKIENEKAKLATFVETAASIKASINSIYLVENPDFVGCHNAAYIHKYDLIKK